MLEKLCKKLKETSPECDVKFNGLNLTYNVKEGSKDKAGLNTLFISYKKNISYGVGVYTQNKGQGIMLKEFVKEEDLLSFIKLLSK